MEGLLLAHDLSSTAESGLNRDEMKDCQWLKPQLVAQINFQISDLYRIFGGADRDRTDDLLNAIQALSQLSYGPTLDRTKGQVL